MTPVADAVPRYDRKTIWLHWLTAILVLSLWCLGQTIDWFPRGAPRIAARSLHICAGAVLGMLLLYRIWWRSTAGARLPPADVGLLQLLAKTAHWLLYLLLIATVALGIFNTWVRGDNLFGLLKIAAFDPGNKALRTTVEDCHALAANVLLALAAAHAAAALLHHYFLKDQVLRRMLPASR